MSTRTISSVGIAPLDWNGSTSWTELSAPTAADDVVATAGSLDMQVTAGAVCRSADFTNYVSTLSGSGDLIIGDGTAGAGNVALKLASGMTVTYTGPLSFKSTSGTQQTVTTAGKTLPGNVTFNGTGSWILSDDLTCATNSTSSILTIQKGTFDANGKNVSTTLLSISGSSVRSITLGSGVWTINGSTFFTAWNALTTTNLTFSGASATINLTDTSNGATCTFAGGGLTYGTVNITAGGTSSWTFSGNNTFVKLNRSGTGTKTIKFTAGSTTTLTAAGTDGFFSGTSGNVWTITSTTNGSAWNLVKTSGSVVCDYISLQDSAASGGATFTPGSNSTNVSGNSGWNFPVGQLPPQSLIITQAVRQSNFY